MLPKDDARPALSLADRCGKAIYQPFAADSLRAGRPCPVLAAGKAVGRGAVLPERYPSRYNGRLPAAIRRDAPPDRAAGKVPFVSKMQPRIA